MRLNREELLRVRTAILDDTRGFDMSDWGIDEDPQETWVKNECGTALCIAGHVLVGRPRLFGMKLGDPATPAAELLGIPDAQLFYTSDWPGWANSAYEVAGNLPEGKAKAQADIAVALIDEILANGYSEAMEWDAPAPRGRQT